MRSLLKLLLALVVLGVVVYFQENLGGHRKGAPRASPGSSASHTAQTWGNPASLPDHFTRHGADFGARDSNQYAEMAAQFLQRARTEGLPAKVDSAGTVRVFDSRTSTFAAYNSDGTTKTFFKTRSRGYFERQPGQPADLRRWR